MTKADLGCVLRRGRCIPGAAPETAPVTATEAAPGVTSGTAPEMAPVTAPGIGEGGNSERGQEVHFAEVSATAALEPLIP